MSDKDSVTKVFMSDNKRFADIFNHYLFKGEEVIKNNGENLIDVSTEEIGVILDRDAEISDIIQKHRDILKQTIVKEDGEVYYLLLGIENQSDIHNAMVIRNLIYDALTYGRQWSAIAKKHREDEKAHKENRYKPSSIEYTSGWYNTDVLKPVITLVVYFGTVKWTGPRSLIEMMKIPENSILKKYINDYKLFLVEPYTMSKEELDKLRTDLKQVFTCLKYATGRRHKEFEEMILNDDSMHSLDIESVILLNKLLDINIKINRKESSNMCEVIEQIREEARKKAIKEEREKIEKERAEEREKIEKERAEEREKLENVKVKLKEKGFTEEQIEDLFS